MAKSVIYRNQANKIFIYNSAQEEENDEKLGGENTSSITILTSGIPEYHIRCQFKSEVSRRSKHKNGSSKNKEESDEETEEKYKAPEEDHKTGIKGLSKHFAPGIDVLLKNSDGKMYLGTIVDSKIESQKQLFRVKFDDNTEQWAREVDLKKLTDCQNNNLMCVVCKISDDSENIKVCFKCSRGYHSVCIRHSPNAGSIWCCDRCISQHETISCSDSEENDERFILPYDVRRQD